MNYIADKIKKSKEGYQGIVVRNLYAIDSLLNDNVNHTNTVIIIPSYLFESILNLGCEINKIVDDDKIDNKEKRITELSKKWIDNNHYPYPLNDEMYHYDTITCKKFGEDVRIIYLVFAFVKQISKLKKRKHIIRIEELEEIKYYSDSLNLREIITSAFEYTNFIESIDMDIDSFIDYINGNYKEDNICDVLTSKIIPVIQNILITYILHKSNSTGFIIENQPVLIHNEGSLEKYHMYSEAKCLMGIVYHYLIKYIITLKDVVTLEPCPYCKSLFTKERNQKYCKDCQSNGIPKRLRDDKYNKSPQGKKYHHNYYKKGKSN